MADDYCMAANDESVQKCAASGLLNCDLSGDDDQLSNCEPNYDRSGDIMLTNSMAGDDVTAHLASSGMAGIAAAAAISSARRRSKNYSFETIPAVRKRQSTRLLRKLQHLIEEYSVRVGQQAVILVCNPKVAHKPAASIESPSNNTNFKVYGSSPLENVVRNMKTIIIQELDTALRNFQLLHEQTVNSTGNQSVWNLSRGGELPPLMVDGIPTPLDKMTQAQLRAFIPVMLKYSTGRGKPGWGRPAARPPWWPDEVPWANVRSDVRTPEEKAQVSWTAALKKVVRMCYEYHGREDLLVDYSQHNNATQSEVVTSTQLLDMDVAHVGNAGHDHSHGNVYTLSMMHMSNADTNSTPAHYAQLHPSYSFKAEKDGILSFIRLDTNNPKTSEAASMEAAATLEDFATDAVSLTSGEDMNMQPFSNTGDMVSLPAGTVMQLDSSSTAALLQIFANANTGSKVNQLGHSPVDTASRKVNNKNV